MLARDAWETPRPAAHRRAVCCALITVALASPLGASDLAIQTTNPREGIYGARVTVASTCTASLHLTVSGSHTSGTFDGCISVTSTATVTGSGPVIFRAGERIGLRPSFRVQSGAAFRARVEASLYPDTYMEDDTPAAETRYAARFYLDATQLAQASSNRFYPFVASRDPGTVEVRVGLKWHSGPPAERRVFVEVRRDNGTFLSTENAFELAVPTGWRWVEVGWDAASAPGANNGLVYLCVESLVTGCYSNSSLDNDQSHIETVRLGALEVPLAGSGTLDFDDYEARQSLYIGAEAPP